MAMTSKRKLQSTSEESTNKGAPNRRVQKLHVGQQISKVLKIRHLNRAQFARKLQVSKAYISAVLGRNPNLTLESILRMCDAVGAELELNIKVKGIDSLRKVVSIREPFDRVKQRKAG